MRQPIAFSRACSSAPHRRRCPWPSRRRPFSASRVIISAPAELRGDALLRAAEIIFIAADDFAAAQIYVLANAADAVVPLGGDGHQRFFRETGAELHVAVQKQQIFAASLFRADKASQPGGRLSFGEQKTARAQGLCRLQALIRRAGIHIDDLVSQNIESGLDALQAGRQAALPRFCR